MKYALSALPELDELLGSAPRVLIATDFDGTLCPIARSPEEVHPAPGTLEILRRIAACSRITLAVISGRALGDVACRLPVPAIFAGNHGLEIQGRGIAFEHPEAKDLRQGLEDACERLQTSLRPFAGAWVEDKRLSATVHYRQVEPRLHSSVLVASRRALASFGRLFALRAGNRALEIRPNVNWEKGSALGHICQELGPYDLTIAIGDDRTDETMFLDAPDNVSVKVGTARPTRARYSLADSTEVAIYLGHVLDVCRLRSGLAAERGRGEELFESRSNPAYRTASAPPIG